MNSELQAYAREILKKDLKECTEDQQHLFKRMYSHKNLNLPIDEVVDNMESHKLDLAMQQVKRTINGE